MIWDFFSLLSGVPEDGDFWSIDTFYSSLREEGITEKEWEGCRKLYKTVKMKNLSDFNDIYNIQDVSILSFILENRWQKVKDETRFDPKCFTSASPLSGIIERIRSKVILTFPKDVETVDLMERLLSGGYSSIYTRLGFNTEMFTPKSLGYVKEKDEIVEKLRNLYGEKNEKAERKNYSKSSMIFSSKQIWIVLINEVTTFDWMGRIKVKKEEFFQKYLN